MKKNRGKAKGNPQREELLPQSDGTYAFIAGFTEGGAPYGVTCEEAAEIEAGEARSDAIVPPAQKSPVSLKDVAVNLGFVSDICTVYYQRSTGDFYPLCDQYRCEDDIADLADWEQEEVELAEKIFANDDGDYVALPSRYDISEYDMMLRFCSTITNRRVADDVMRSLAGRGAFRKFKSAIQRHGIQQSWYRFREDAFKEVAKEWCEENGLTWCD